MKASTAVVTLLATLMAVPAVAQVAATTSSGSAIDAFQGATPYIVSDLYPGSSAADLFGGNMSVVEPGNTIFSDDNSGPLVAFDIGTVRRISRIVVTLADDSNSRSIERGLSGALRVGATNDAFNIPVIASLDILPNYTLSYGSSNITATFSFASPDAYRYYAIAGNNASSLGARIVEIDGFTDAVPEPVTWAMMMLGFGVVGYGVRRRQARPRPESRSPDLNVSQSCE